jgi:hypothetical protein
MEDEEMRKGHHPLLDFVLWEIWLVRNGSLFQNKVFSPMMIYYKVQGVDKAYMVEL